jgi:hypothetical protein
MKPKIIALATMFALSSAFAFAQATVPDNSINGNPGAVGNGFINNGNGNTMGSAGTSGNPLGGATATNPLGGATAANPLGGASGMGTTSSTTGRARAR